MTPMTVFFILRDPTADWPSHNIRSVAGRYQLPSMCGKPVMHFVIVMPMT